MRKKQFVEKDSLDRSFRSPFGTVAGTVMIRDPD